jgi:ketosteroid isomerase-like protein
MSPDTHTEDAMPESDDLKILEELNRSYVRAAEMSDVGWYTEHLAEDFLASNPDGSIADREAFLARIGRPQADRDLAPVDVRIRIIGDVALIHSGFRATKPDGQTVRGRYTDVYARRGGRWLCISAHFNRF